MRAGNLTLTEHEREGLKASIKEDENSAAIEYAESMLAVSNPANLESIWKGYQSIPKQYGNDGFEIIFQSINGSIQSPRYGMEYHENDYKADKFIHIILDLSPVLHLIGNGMLVVNLELDTRQLEGCMNHWSTRSVPVTSSTGNRRHGLRLRITAKDMENNLHQFCQTKNCMNLRVFPLSAVFMMSKKVSQC